jgi:hypothetical protein
MVSRTIPSKSEQMACHRVETSLLIGEGTRACSSPFPRMGAGRFWGCFACSSDAPCALSLCRKRVFEFFVDFLGVLAGFLVAVFFATETSLQGLLFKAPGLVFLPPGPETGPEAGGKSRKENQLRGPTAAAHI